MSEEELLLGFLSNWDFIHWDIKPVKPSVCLLGRAPWPSLKLFSVVQSSVAVVRGAGRSRHPSTLPGPEGFGTLSTRPRCWGAPWEGSHAQNPPGPAPTHGACTPGQCSFPKEPHALRFKPKGPKPSAWIYFVLGIFFLFIFFFYIAFLTVKMSFLLPSP